MKIALRKKALAIAVAVSVAGIALAGCTGTNTSSSTDSTVTIAGDTGGPFPNNLNPVSPTNGMSLTRSFVYEPLLMFNYLKPDQVTPWLATSYKWSDDGKTLTFKTRSGVKWNDGKPFSAKDVAFTFNYLKKYPATNSNGISFDTASAPDDNTVQLTFPDANYANLYYIGIQWILPEHIWSSVSNPIAATNLQPVGTGPYKIQSFTPQQITLEKNPNYWQPGKPKIDKVVYASSNSNNSPNLALSNGQANWGGVFFPGIKEQYVDKDPHHKYWFPPTTDLVLYVNLTKEPLNNVALRQAISDALDRKAINQASSLGLVPNLTNPTGLTPFQSDSLADQYKTATYTQDVSKAKQELQAAGFTYKGDVLYDPTGKPVELGLTMSAPYSDNVASGTEIAKQLAAIGIKIDLKPEAVTQWQSDLSTGNYDLGFRFSTTGPGPYYMYNNWLNSALTAPVGQTAAGNYSRWNDPKTDALLKQYATSNDPAVKKQALDGLQDVMVKQLPVIPVQYQAYWGEYNDKDVVGWPDPKDPYALSSTYDEPMNLLVLLNLQPRK